MRVLMATMQLDIGGAETHIVELSKALTRRGVEVIVASNGGAYEPELAAAGIRHVQVPFHSKNPACLRAAYRRLREIIFENQIDVVHAHARIPAFLCGLLQRRYHFRFVTTAHWVFTTRFPYNLLTSWGDRSLAVSDDIKAYLMDSYGIPEEHIRVTINGIDLAKFSAQTDYSAVAEEFGLTPGALRIVYVSRMDTDRSLAAHTLLEIAPRLGQEFPNLEIVIVGGGNDYEAVAAQAQAVNAAAGRRLVITAGSRTDINQFTAAGDLFIGVSRAALEAMACEKPAIIAGNEGYIGIFDQTKLQTARDTNFCCRGCPPVTPEALLRDVETVLRAEPGRRALLGAYARETVQNYYSVDTMADDAMRLYISVIKNSQINQVSPQEFADIDAYLLTNPIRVSRGRIDVMISGYYGFHNSGDDSILKAMVDGLSASRPDLRILALSNDPAETKAVYGIDAIHRFNLLRIAWNLRKTRLLISGGGSLIQDVTSDKSLTYYLTIIRLAAWMGARVMLYANGIGPVCRERNRERVRKTLSKVDLITLREPSSLKELKRFGVEGPQVAVTADPAFNLTAASPAEAAALVERTGLPKGARYCGIAIRPWKGAAPDLEEAVARIADHIRRRHGLEVLFIPMQEDKDLELARRTMARMEERGYLLTGRPSPSQILGVVGGAELIIGMRLHTLIYAAKMGTPVIGLAYDPKVDAAMAYLHQVYTEPAARPNPLTVCRYVDEILARRQTEARSLRETARAFEKKAQENTALALGLLELGDGAGALGLIPQEAGRENREASQERKSL